MQDQWQNKKQAWKSWEVANFFSLVASSKAPKHMAPNAGFCTNSTEEIVEVVTRHLYSGGKSSCSLDASQSFAHPLNN
jgi:hypothetical protein